MMITGATTGTPLQTTARFQWPATLIVQWGGGVSSLIGLAGIAGWLLHVPILLRIWPGTPPMVFGTACGFLLAGIGLLAALRERTQTCRVLSVAILLIGLYRLMERLLQPPSADPRMAMATAVVLMLIGFCLALCSGGTLSQVRSWVGALTATTIMSIGCLGLLALVAGFTTGTQWDSFLARMSLPACLAAIAVGASLGHVFWLRSRGAGEQVAVATIVLTLAGMLILFAGVDVAVVVSTNATLQSRADVARTHGKIRVVERLLEAIRASESGQLGYSLTGAAGYRRSYTEAAHTLQPILHELETAPFDPRRTQRIRSLALLKMAGLQHAIDFESQGRREEVVRMIQSPEWMALMNQISLEAASLTNLLKVELEQQNLQNRRSVELVKVTTELSYFIAAMLTGVALLIVTKELRRHSRFQSILLKNELDLEARIVKRTIELESEIANRVEVEELLRRSEERLSAALSFANVVAWNWTPADDRVVWHGPVRQVFGATPETLSTYVAFRGLIHPEDQAITDNATRIGTSYDAEFRIVRPDGEVRWIAGRGGARVDGDVVLEMSGINFDVTEQKLAKQALERSESRLREQDDQLSLIFDRGTIGNFSWDLVTEMITCHPSVWKLYGGPEKSQEHASWFTKRFHPDDAAATSQKVSAALESGRELDLEFRVVRLDGSVCWLECRAAVTRDSNGKAVRVDGLNIDITPRKMAEIELKQRESQFRGLANAMPQIVWTARPDGTVDYHNDRWYELTGFPRGQGSGKSWHSILHSCDAPACLESWCRCVQSGEPYESEVRFLHQKTQKYCWYLIRAIPVRDDQGRIVSWFGTCTDVHQQKTAKEILETEVQTRTEQLRQSLTEKQTLLKELHHRVKNNLQVISSLLKMQSKSLQDPAAIAALEESRQRVFSMALIHERLYGNEQVTHLDLGPYTRTLVDELIRSYAWSAKIVPIVKASTILLGIDQAIPCGLIVNELVTNALKYAYSENGEGEISVSLIENGKGLVRLTVADRGAGLKPGFQWKNSKSIGLSIVDILATQLGGKWWVDDCNPGASFTVEFPKEEESEQIAA